MMSRQVDLSSPPAEAAVLGTILTAPDAWHRVANLLCEEDFCGHGHRLLWRCVSRRAQAGLPNDLVSVGEDLRETGDIAAVGGYPVLGDLMFDASSCIEHHARRLSEMGRRRRIADFGRRLLQDAATTPSDTMIGRCATEIVNLSRGATDAAMPFSACVEAGVAALEIARQRRKNGVLGVSTTLPALDHLLGGIYGPNLIVFAGRPGLGKTALVNQIALHAARRGQPGLFMSIEMSAGQLAQRAASLVSGVSLSLISRAYPEATGAIDRLVNLGQLPMWIDDQTSDLDALCARIAMHRHRDGIEWAAVDHLGLIRTERFNSRNEQMGHISWTLKQLAKRLNMPIIALSQLSRRSEQECRRPRADDLRDSGNLEQDADVIVMLHTDQDDRSLPVRPVQIGIVKNRLGPCTWLKARINFDGATQTFREIADESMATAGSVPRHWQE